MVFVLYSHVIKGRTNIFFISRRIRMSGNMW